MSGGPLDEGIELYNRRDFAGAVKCFTRALKTRKRDVNALLFRALSSQMLGRGDAALEDMRAALKCDPTDASLHLAAVGMFRALGKRREALKHAELAAKLGPAGGDAWGVKAELELEAGLEERARASFTEAMARGLKAQTLRERAAVFFQEAAEDKFRRYLYRDAEKDYRAALQASRTWRKAHLGLGELCRVRGRRDEAIRHFENAAKLTPVDPIAFLKLGELYLAERRLGLAQRALEQAAEAGSTVRARLLLGRLFLDEKRADEAQAQFRAAAGAGRGEDNPLAADLGRLEACMRLERFADAFAAADALFDAEPTQDRLWTLFQAMGLPERPPRRRPPLLDALAAFAERQPGEIWAHLLLAYFYDRLALYEAAMRAAEVLGRAPKAKRWMLYIRGELRLLRRGDYAGAAADFKAAYACVPGMWNARAMEAEILCCRGKTPRALERMDALYKKHSGRVAAEILAWRGEFLLWAGRYKAALKDLDAALRGGARFARTWRGAARLKLGDAEAALDDLTQATMLDRGDTEAWVWRAEALLALGRRDEALRVLEHADCRANYWGNMLRAGVHAARRDAAALDGALTAIWEPARRRVEELSPHPAGGKRAAAYWSKALAKALARGKGLRRAEPHLLALW